MKWEKWKMLTADPEANENWFYGSIWKVQGQVPRAPTGWPQGQHWRQRWSQRKEAGPLQPEAGGRRNGREHKRIWERQKCSTAGGRRWGAHYMMAYMCQTYPTSLTESTALHLSSARRVECCPQKRKALNSDPQHLLKSHCGDAHLESQCWRDEDRQDASLPNWGIQIKWEGVSENNLENNWGRPPTLTSGLNVQAHTHLCSTPTHMCNPQPPTPICHLDNTLSICKQPRTQCLTHTWGCAAAWWYPPCRWKDACDHIRWKKCHVSLNLEQVQH